MLSNILACLSGAMEYAILPCKYIMYNPCNGVKIGRVDDDPRLKEKREYILPQEEYLRIIERFNENTNFYIPIVIGYHLGTRIGETYGFDLSRDIDFEKHEIKIARQLKKEEGTWFYRPPKYNSYRTIKIGNTVEEDLKRCIAQRKENVLKYGEYYIKSYIGKNQELIQAPASVPIALPEITPISVKENGEILTPESFKYCARAIHQELGNPLFHSHCLRHTHGTILAENGANPKTVMERLGHKDIQTTMNTYVFNTDKMQQDAVDIFEQAIS